MTAGNRGSTAGALSARKLLMRDWRGGELGVLLAALILAVGVIVGISGFVGSLQSALESESLRFLAADSVVASRSEPPSEWQQQASAAGLETANLVAFASMAVTEEDNLYLASVKAVSDAYPLRGVLQFSREPYGPAETVARIPAPGEVWLAPRLFSLLDVVSGDPLWIGDAEFRIGGAVRAEPDSTSSLFGYGPRLLMNIADIPATNVIQPGSRVNYRLLLKGDAEALERFAEWVTPQLGQGQRLLGLDDSEPRIGRTLDRARGFLLLAGSLGVVLAAAAIALAARRFSERHTDYVAIMKSLGASSARINRLYGTSLLLLGLLATALGCGAGWGIQALFFLFFADQLGVEPGATGIEPYVIGGATALVCLGFFAWPPLRRLAQVPPLRVLRRDVDADSAQRPLDYLLGALATVGLMWWYSGDATLTGGVVAGLLLTVGAGFVVARLLLKSGRIVGGAAGSIWRLALAGLVRRGNANALQMVIFAIAIMLLLVLTIVRTSLIDQWQAQLPPGTPNHFMLNIAPEQQAPLAEFFDERQITREPMYPMSRGRVMAVNGEELANSDDQQAERRQAEANFTYSATMPEANELLEGAWWQSGTSEAVVSLEQSFAARVGATLGDVITLRIGAQAFDATVTSLRESDWQSMKPNFFAIFPKQLLEPFPKMYLTSFYLPPAEKATLNSLVKAFPTATVIELDIVIGEIRGIVDQVGRAIELVLAVIFLSGALVLIAGVQSSVDVRLRESALLRALGARKGLLLGALWIEFATLGAFAGLLAVLGAEASAWALQTQALDLSYRPTPWIWPLGIVVGALVIAVLGVMSCHKAVKAPPLVVLRDLS